MKIPTEALNQHIAILGKTGAGKTFCAKGIIETLLDQKRQVCVIDPTSAWWGLRLAASGKQPSGYHIVLIGGKHGDIPLSSKSGAAVANLVTQQHANVVIDTSGMTVGEYTQWFIDFAGTLYTTIRKPLYLVIDEAHYFMPQGKAPDPQAGRMIHAGNRLMSGGRSLGIRGIMVTQRPAKLHKDSLTCADTLISMRVIAPQDRQAIKDWIDGCGDAVQGKDVLDSLAQLNRGEGWIWYPEGAFLERTKFPPIKTYDSSATPKHGESAATPKITEINLAEVKAAMAVAIEEAKANDPAELRKMVADLRKQLAAKQPPAAAPAPPKIFEVPVLKNGQLDRTEKAIDRVSKAIEQIDVVGAKMREELGELRRLVQPAFATKAPAVDARLQRGVDRFNRLPAVPRPAARITAPSPLPKARSSESSESLPQGERRVLVAIAQYNGRCTREQLTMLTGYKRSTRDRYIQFVREKGYADANGDNFTITAEGLGAIGEYEELPTGHELLKYWLGRLPQGEVAILKVVSDGWPEPVMRDEISEKTNYKRSTRDRYIQFLESRFLVKSDRGAVRASDELFDLVLGNDHPANVR